MTAEGRPQDQGRRHRARGAPSAATATLLERYQETMRAELSRLLDELAAVTTQTQLDGGTSSAPALGITARTERWTLATKLARELGTEVDPRPPADAPRARRRGPAKIDFG